MTHKLPIYEKSLQGTQDSMEVGGGKAHSQPTDAEGN